MMLFKQLTMPIVALLVLACVQSVVSQDAHPVPDTLPLEETWPAGISNMARRSLHQSCKSVLQALKDAGLTSMASAISNSDDRYKITESGNSKTIFAFTNSAFKNMANSRGLSTSSVLASNDALEEIVEHHVLPGRKLTAGSISGTKNYRTLDSDYDDFDDRLKVKKNSTGVFVSVPGSATAKVIRTNIRACDTIIHVINKVVLTYDAKEELRELKNGDDARWDGDNDDDRWDD